MLITIIAWIYITLLSYCWGRLFLQLVSKSLSGSEIFKTHPAVTCFTGIVLISGVANLVSFFLPLGLGAIQLIFLLPVILNVKHIWKDIAKQKTRWQRVNIFLFTCCLVLILVMSTFTISHPDSLGYHVQIIKWIEEYKIIPGLANLNARFGFQSNWFVICALLNFKFLGTGSYVYLNSLVCIWVLFFAISKINQAFIVKKNKELWLWIGFITLTFSSYTQVLLTATSASPDYIAAIYIWLAFYFLFHSEKGFTAQSFVLVIVFSFFAFCVKLSTVPVVIAGVYALIKLISAQKLKAFFLSVSLVTAMVLCFIGRNAVTSGYLLYPSTFPNIVSCDWKIPEKRAQREQAYVTSFARTESGTSNDDEANALINNMKLKEWIPVWWSKRTLPDKIVLIIAALSSVVLIVSFKKIQKTPLSVRIGAISTFAGLLFWFLMGPDPRFGFGFIIGLIGLTLSIVLPETVFDLINRKLVLFVLWTLNVILLGYIVYRFSNYFSPEQLIHADGVKLEPGSTVQCEKNTFYIAAPFKGCGGNPIPCIEGSCKHFLLRGSTIADGFKPKVAD